MNRREYTVGDDKNIESNNIIVAKVILVGDSNVGKTTIRKRFMGEGFASSHLPTIGADLSNKIILLKSPKGEIVEVNLHIWDIAGQTTFSLMRKRFLVGAHIAILVYDRTDKESFNHMDFWIREVAEAGESGIIPLIIVGNKSDLEDDIVVFNIDVQRYAQELRDRQWSVSSFIHKLYTSALTGRNIDELFKFACTSYLTILSRDESWLNAEMILT